MRAATFTDLLIKDNVKLNFLSGEGTRHLIIDNAGNVSASVLSVDYNTQVTNKPTIPQQVNLIAGTNVTITGTYPNLTISASGGSGGGDAYLAATQTFTGVNTFESNIIASGGIITGTNPTASNLSVPNSLTPNSTTSTFLTPAPLQGSTMYYRRAMRGNSAVTVVANANYAGTIFGLEAINTSSAAGSVHAAMGTVIMRPTYISKHANSTVTDSFILYLDGDATLNNDVTGRNIGLWSAGSAMTVLEGPLNLPNITTGGTEMVTVGADGTLYKQPIPGGGGGSSPWTQSGGSIYYTGGNVGIGKTSPEYLFEVHREDTDMTTPIARIGNSTRSVTILPRGITIGPDGNSGINFTDGGSVVGSGSTNPLHVRTTSNNTHVVLQGIGINRGNVLIGDVTNEASSILTIHSTTKGVLLPRMTTAQKTSISSPANGLMVYDNTLNSFEYYDGSSWKAPVTTITAGTGISVNRVGNSVTISASGGGGGGGITSLNGLTGSTQTFAIGTGTLGWSSVGTTHTLNIPNASTSVKGLLTAADFTTFNNKLSNITGHITAGTNVTITGSGTLASPYVISASGGGGGGTPVYFDGVDFAGTGTSEDPYRLAVTPIADPGSNGIIIRTGLNTTNARTIVAQNNKISVSNGDGIAGNPTIGINEGNVVINNLNGTLSIAKGGTGASNATSAINNLLPSQTGNSGKVLSSNGSNALWRSFDELFGGQYYQFEGTCTNVESEKTIGLITDNLNPGEFGLLEVTVVMLGDDEEERDSEKFLVEYHVGVSDTVQIGPKTSIKTNEGLGFFVEIGTDGIVNEEIQVKAKNTGYTGTMMYTVYIKRFRLKTIAA